MEIFKTQPTIDFLGQRKIAYVISLLIIIAFVYIWIERGPDKYGIDFRGGNEFIVRLDQVKTEAEDLSSALEKNGLQGVGVQSFEPGSQEYAIRVGQVTGVDSKAVQDRVNASLKQLFGDKYKILKSDSVGATIGQELKRSALWAIALGIVLVLAYIAFRFEFSFGLGAVIAMFHDVIFGAAVYLWAGYSLNGAALAAALTIVGYSVNDTIVIFDRVREQMHKRKDASLAELMNDSMNACLSRTIITGGLTLFAVIALYLFGGGAIKDLSLFLLAGMVSGMYSTVYIAAPVALWWEDFREWRTARAK